MDKRVLLGCIAALATMLGFDLLTQLSGRQIDLPMRTPLGTILVGSLAITFAAMTLGGWIARHRFRWIAVVLSAVVWAATIVALVANGTTMSLRVIFQFNALAIALSLVAAWLGAVLGERLAERGRSPVPGG